MIEFQVDEASVERVDASLERSRLDILKAIRGGVMESMEGLARVVAGKLFGDPIQSRTGALLAAVLSSPRVTETRDVIRGTVSADVGAKHLGLWFEEGTHVKAVEGNLFQFTAADGASVFTHGHAAFQVAPHPIMNPSLVEYRPTILATIESRISEAVHAAV